ncbi:MAG: hypothetical protein A2725_02850 [Candidatus Magasanikbacteria bacterium RIFCSPHIGHO2_01_FULL_33_34]|uniref:DDH domain-containing protein n=1 Tax=Candidatus Magasanikbacteria bacterium RIFCSPHIGHO2_01_FULL_33_34 TaxID=1798671 RepID=A0A1F6LH29_9BACT|nr:MAG: hypothetical protein A2725_02850 [Candidatus Magasanikbacteria bacterium RIFCSPHIGHO2_01_FULL_33_34]OGH66073.1 MAG: hypothetical protein A3B83_00340 [Candidatus Magasanikbacteria bacterium RIFCSPHIGHO2_02_FULL_33_17]OGH75919.1 MAG: hypothetical protein A3A89_00250 [Candidatus Magasanikbacteria bacterium RIFCSPLOWO2_01_FULL_33_34]OGH81696.1 MAG: hypothetical protein A3F93_02045 [Candidatus Magasanikbacteria bacterium RIFCSPLOWO2_12_FULL_34_7]
MSFTNTQQIKQLISDKKQILITFSRDASIDSISSALALLLFLEKQSKPVDIVCDNFSLPNQCKFLKQSDQIKNNFDYLQKFIISIDVEKTGVQELSYDMKNEKLRIFITPKQGYLNQDNIKTAQSDFRYDLIFVVGTPDLESLGSIYDNNTDLFYKTPIINIDNQSGNEHFGQINCIDLTCSSTTEILFDLLKNIGEEYIDENIATALLTGIISETKSFKAENIKPFTLNTASKLIDMGANREKIINNLYRNRTIPMLKLWGNTLTHMQSNKNIGLVWSTITKDDFTRSNAKEDDLRDIIDELISTSPEAKITLLIHEHTNSNENKIHVIINSKKNIDLKQLLTKYKPTGSKDKISFFVENKTLKEVEEEIVEELIKIIKE